MSTTDYFHVGNELQCWKSFDLINIEVGNRSPVTRHGTRESQGAANPGVEPGSLCAFVGFVST